MSYGSADQRVGDRRRARRRQLLRGCARQQLGQAASHFRVARRRTLAAALFPTRFQRRSRWITTGNAYHLEASPVASVGGLDFTSLSTHGVASTDIQQYHLAEPDPYASKVDTSIPSTLQSSCTNNNYNSHKYNVGTGQNAVAHITPGCFTNFSPGNGITVLGPRCILSGKYEHQLDGDSSRFRERG